MALSTARKKQFRTIGHKLNPIITVAGNGITETIKQELERTLTDHELIKIKLVLEDRDERKQAAQTLCKLGRAEIIQEIGKVVMLYRENKDADPRKSNIARNPI